MEEDQPAMEVGGFPSLTLIDSERKTYWLKKNSICSARLIKSSISFFSLIVYVTVSRLVLSESGKKNKIKGLIYLKCDLSQTKTQMLFPENLPETQVSNQSIQGFRGLGTP